MHEYDTALKLMLRARAQVTLNQLTGVAIERWLNVELPQIRNTRMDMLGETADMTLVQLQLQSRNDSRMALRMAECSLAAYGLYERFPQQIVLYVGQARCGCRQN